MNRILKNLPRAENYTWAYCPDVDLSGAYERRVFEASFGDGYKLRLQNGINNISETYELAFTNRKEPELNAMRDFLAMVGVNAFNYALPNQTEFRVVCDKWNLRLSGKTGDGTIYGDLTATFVRVWGI
jgi:phage-related protein